MKTKTFSVLAALAALALTGCGRDTKVNSDPMAGQRSSADTGKPATSAQPTASGQATTSPTTGTDSAGRPADASGGTTGAGAGSGTSGTQTDNAASRQPKK